MVRRTRLDAELVRRGLARSREQAVALIEAGRVEVRGTAARKPAAMVDPADPVRIRADGAPQYASRGGHKLAGALVDLTVAYLSFISLRLVLPALAACTGPDGDLVPMVKPQFEVGRERVGSGGVVRDPALRTEA